MIAYVAGIAAARRLGARLASFTGMAEVFFAVLFAWLLLGQLPSPMEFLGGTSCPGPAHRTADDQSTPHGG